MSRYVTASSVVADARHVALPLTLGKVLSVNRTRLHVFLNFYVDGVVLRIKVFKKFFKEKMYSEVL